MNKQKHKTSTDHMQDLLEVLLEVHNVDQNKRLHPQREFGVIVSDLQRSTRGLLNSIMDGDDGPEGIVELRDWYIRFLLPKESHDHTFKKKD